MLILIMIFNEYNQNVRKLRTKLNTLYLNMHDLNYDYFLLTQMWLHGEINNNEPGLIL